MLNGSAHHQRQLLRARPVLTLFTRWSSRMARTRTYTVLRVCRASGLMTVLSSPTIRTRISTVGQSAQISCTDLTTRIIECNIYWGILALPRKVVPYMDLNLPLRRIGASNAGIKCGQHIKIRIWIAVGIMVRSVVFSETLREGFLITTIASIVCGCCFCETRLAITFLHVVSWRYFEGGSLKCLLISFLSVHDSIIICWGTLDLGRRLAVQKTFWNGCGQSWELEIWDSVSGIVFENQVLSFPEIQWSIPWIYLWRYRRYWLV